MKKMIGMSEKRNGLYYYKELEKSVCFQSTCHQPLSLNLWHQRLSYPPEQHLKESLQDIFISFLKK